MKTKLLTLVLLIISNTLLVFGQPGTLDGTFGNNGIVVTNFGNGDDWGWAITTQTNGKIIVVGGVDVQGTFDQDFGVVRYNLDGSRDNTFDSDGMVSTAVGSDYDEAYAVAVQVDGKILVAGLSNYDFALVRYNGDGSLDNTFDTDGIVHTHFGGYEDDAESIAIQPDGKIIVTGFSDLNDGVFATARYNQNGSLDTSFDADGKVITDIGGDFDGAFSVALQQDGKIYVAGTSDNGTDYDFAIVRYNPDGSLDTSFNTNGICVTDFEGEYDVIRSIVIQQDGKILTSGVANIASVGHFALARYNIDGSLDNSFGTSGKVMTDFGGSYAIGVSALLQPDNKIIVAGGTGTGGTGFFALARYNPDGSLDSSFGTNGKTTTQVGSTSWGASGTLQPDGKIVMAGNTGPELDKDFAVVRYNSGLLDTDDFSNEKNPFRIYPNPTSGILNIDSETTITQIEIYNLLGQLVKSNTNQNIIDIFSVNQGIYFIKVMDENGNIGSQKLLKK
jgi:uncharacterized delta-60 repeat protein